MKKIAWLVTALLLSTLVHGAANAQDQTAYELEHQLAETRRQAVVAASLPLLDSEAEGFWALYLEYRAAAKRMDDQRMGLIRRYASNYEDLTGEQGDDLVTDALRVERDRESLKHRYFKRFARLLPGQRLFRYYQIETKLDAIQRYDWTQQIPLAPVTD